MEMKCVRVTEIGGFHLMQVPAPKPKEGEVLVKVTVAGLCRTDLKLIRAGHRDLVLPRIPGEEAVGVIAEVGKGVGDLREGDPVYVYPGTFCGTCPSCLGGAENLCRAMRIMGFHRDGGFAEYLTAPVQSVIPIPTGLSSDEAVFAEPLSCCLNALELSGVKEGMSVGVWGAGPAGALLARASRALGAEALSIEPDEKRRNRTAGAASGRGHFFDVCVVAVGKREAYEEALDCLNPRGCLVAFSGLSPAEERLSLSLNRMHYLEQTLVGAYGCCERHGRRALELISEGSVPVVDLISHRMALDALGEALDIVENRRGMKVLLYPWQQNGSGFRPSSAGKKSDAAPK